MQEFNNNKICLTDETQDAHSLSADGYDYSKYKNLSDFDWDDELEKKFAPIAQKLNLSQDSVDLLLELALEMSQKQRNMYSQDENIKYQNDVQKYNKLLVEDRELPSVNSSQMREYLRIANGAYSDFTSPKLKEMFEKTGLIYHPELIKMFHKIGELSQEDNLSHYGKPSVEELTPAQILYGTK